MFGEKKAVGVFQPGEHETFEVSLPDMKIISYVCHSEEATHSIIMAEKILRRPEIQCQMTNGGVGLLRMTAKV